MGEQSMMIGMVTGAVLLIAILKYKARIILRVLMQMILGGISIYLVNFFLAQKGVSTIIAINPLTILTSGLLGFPGVFLLFAIQFLSII